MDSFPAILLMSRVIIVRTKITNAPTSFIEDNSRLEEKSGKRIRQSLGDVVGLKQAAFHRLTEFEITCGHRLFSVHLPQTAVQIDKQSVLAADLIISLKLRAF